MSIERIAKLLQMAEQATNTDEAAAFFAKAQQLATAQEISLAEARQHRPEREREAPVQQAVRVGRPRQQANRHYLQLLVALAQSNGCEIGLYNNNTAAVLFGLPRDIATVEALFAAIAPQMVRLGEEFLAAGSWRGERVVDLRSGLTRTVTKQGARASFYQGFTRTLSGRIREAARKAREDAARAERERAQHFHAEQSPSKPGAAATSGVEVALRAKELEVKTFAQQHLGGGTWRGGRTTTAVAPASYRAGGRAAKRVRFAEQRAVGGGGRELDA